jgi:hypothetical protein
MGLTADMPLCVKRSKSGYGLGILDLVNVKTILLPALVTSDYLTKTQQPIKDLIVVKPLED